MIVEDLSFVLGGREGLLVCFCFCGLAMSLQGFVLVGERVDWIIVLLRSYDCVFPS